MKLPANEIEQNLAQFYGSEHYYRSLSPLMVYTDGVKWLADNAGCHWLIDAIASYQMKCQKYEMLRYFQIWELKVTDKSAVLTCIADTGHKPKVTQKIEYTDFPLQTIKLYVEIGNCGGKEVMVLMLPRER